MAYDRLMHNTWSIHALNRTIDLKRIQHFALLGESLHFSRAAERANLSQTAFSRSIKALEDDFQLQLFDRDTRTVELTYAGKQLLTLARDLLHTANNLKIEAAHIAKTEGGELNVGAGFMLMNQTASLVLEELRRISPKLKLNIEFNHGEALNLNLLAENIEFYVANADSFIDDPRFTITPLFSVASSFFCHSQHPLALQGAPISREQLLNYPWSAVHIHNPGLNILSKLCNVSSSKQLPVVLNCNNLEMLRHTLMNSHSLLVTWRNWLEEDINRGDVIDLAALVQPPLSDEPIMMDCCVVQLAGRTLSPLARHTIQKIRELNNPI